MRTEIFRLRSLAESKPVFANYSYSKSNIFNVDILQIIQSDLFSIIDSTL